MGVPGPVEFATGTVVQPPIMPGWDGVVVPEVLSEYFDAPILVDNDVNIMAPRGVLIAPPRGREVLFVKVATGIGCGIVTNGEVHRGADGAAGDIGHMRVAGERRRGVLVRQHQLPGGGRVRLRGWSASSLRKGST